VKVSQFELGWLAGIIDGEGSILIVKRGPTYVPEVKMSNTSKALIDAYCDILDRLDISYHCYGTHKAGNRKYQWAVAVSGRPRVNKFLLIIQDLIIARRKQAEKVLQWIELRGLDLRGPYTVEQLNLRDELRKLNARGRAGSEV
jgi:hypothetical protein